MTFEQLMGIGTEFPNNPLKQLHENNRSAYKEIKTLVSQNNLIPFIGAGFSVPIYPIWKKFLESTAQSYPNCIEKVHDYIAKGEYEEAADALCEEMTSFTFRQRISAVFSRSHLEENQDKLSRERKLLSQLFRGNILTTNYDKVLETIYGNSIKTLCPHTDYTQPLIKELQQSNHPAIIKLHGDVEDVYNAVITGNDYNTRYGTSELKTPLVQALEQILSARPVLFMGCSLDSDRTLRVLSSCTGSNRKYFALVELPKETCNVDSPFLPNILEKDGCENKVS